MGKVQVGRTCTVDAPLEVVKQRLISFGRLYEFYVARDDGKSLEFRRGGLIGSLFSFDVQNVSTVLTADLHASNGRISVAVVLIARAPFAIFMASDRVTLEKQMDVLVATLKDS